MSFQLCTLAQISLHNERFSAKWDFIQNWRVKIVFFSEIHGKEVILPAAQKAVRDKLNIAKLDTYGDALEFYST